MVLMEACSVASLAPVIGPGANRPFSFGWWSKAGVSRVLRNRLKQAWESEVASCGEGSRISSCSR
jgi:hypothetical protein